MSSEVQSKNKIIKIISVVALVSSCIYYSEHVTHLFSEGYHSFFGNTKEKDEIRADIANGITYYNQNNFQESFRLLDKCKEQDEFTPEACSCLGLLYFQKNDYARSFKYCMEAAKNGNAIAENHIGYLYYNGFGTKKDLDKSIEWYRKAADQGDANALTNLGNKYYNGEGVMKDYSTAYNFYYQAALKGFDLAQTMLGKMLYYGTGVTSNKSNAIYWLNEAAKKNNKEAKNLLDSIQRAENIFRTNQ